jgi:predicted O-linked N-acetylglucosamine transferase (SPINDLY family)
MFNWIRRKSAAGPQSDGPRQPDRAAPIPLENADDLKKEGDRFLKEGLLEEAAVHYRKVLAIDVQHRDALINLGFVLSEKGQVAEALPFLERAVAIDPADPDARFLLGKMLQAAGSPSAARPHLERAIALRPGFEQAYRELVVVLFLEGLTEEATQCCEKGLAICPQSAELHYYRSNLYRHNRDLDRAITSCEHALELRPGLKSACASLAVMIRDRLNSAEPDASGQAALAAARAYLALGNAYFGHIDYGQARAAFESAVALAPEVAEYHFYLGYVFSAMNRNAEARACYDEALALDPDDARTRWAKIMLHAPAYHDDGSSTLAARLELEKSLREFESWWEGTPCDGEQFVGVGSPFYLTYEETSNRAIMERYGSICARSMDRWLSRQTFAPAPHETPNPRLRIALVSGEIRVHSVWFALTKGWLLHLDRSRFEVIVLSLEYVEDSEFQQARALADRFVAGPKKLVEWVQLLRDLRPDVVFHPAIGLNSTTQQLASMRLAPIQISTWGHPDTSGLPTIDYYLSGADFEPADANEEYSEQLVCLPRLGNSYQGVRTVGRTPDWDALGIDRTRPLLVCAGTAFKYQPIHDRLYAEIVRRLPGCQLLFFRLVPAHLADLLKTRLGDVFAAAGVDFEAHVRFMDPLSRHEFHGLLEHSDMLLDTIGFSGYNTAIQAIECGLPVVTREGRFLRGRLASGILRIMEIPELIAQTDDEYVELAVALASDRLFQDRMRAAIIARRGILFDDIEPVRALEEFLLERHRELDSGRTPTASTATS